MARSLHVRSITPGKMVGGRFVANPSGKMKLGRGGRFKKLESEIAARGGSYDPQAVAAAIGMKKYGKKRMEKMAHKARARRNPAKYIVTLGHHHYSEHRTAAAARKAAKRAVKKAKKTGVYSPQAFIRGPYGFDEAVSNPRRKNRRRK